MATEDHTILIDAFVPTAVSYPLPECGFAHIPPAVSKAVLGGTMHFNYYDPNVVSGSDTPAPANVVERRRRVVKAILAPSEVYPTPVIGFDHLPPAVNYPITGGEMECNYFEFYVGAGPSMDPIADGLDLVFDGVDQVVNG